MSKLSKVLIVMTTTILISLITKAFILDESVKTYLVTFFFVGAGLALLRLFINFMIVKMKDKNIFVKIGFFAALLSIGLPFQNWFRTDIIFAMSKSFIAPSITVMIASVILMTIVYNFSLKTIHTKQKKRIISEA